MPRFKVTLTLGNGRKVEYVTEDLPDGAAVEQEIQQMGRMPLIVRWEPVKEVTTSVAPPKIKEEK